MSDGVIKKAMLFLKDKKAFDGYVDRGAEFGVKQGMYPDMDSARRVFLDEEYNEILDEYDNLCEVIANTKNNANEGNRGARELGRNASAKRIVLLRYKQMVVEELKKAILKEKQKDRAAGIAEKEESWEKDREDFYEERAREAVMERGKLDRKYEVEKEEEKKEEFEERKEFEDSGMSAADIETAKIAARELIYNERVFDSVNFLHDEGYEHSAKQAALLSKTFLNDLDKGKKQPDKRAKGKAGDGKTASERKSDRKIKLFPAKKNEFYGPGVLSVGEKTAVMVLSHSMAVVYKTQDIAKSFPPGSAVEIKTMRVKENNQIEAYKHDRNEKIRWLHGKPC